MTWRGFTLSALQTFQGKTVSLSYEVNVLKVLRNRSLRNWIFHLFFKDEDTSFPVVWTNNIWDKEFKNGQSKICGRWCLKYFTWPILEYSVSYFIVYIIQTNWSPCDPLIITVAIIFWLISLLVIVIIIVIIVNTKADLEIYFWLLVVCTYLPPHFSTISILKFI